MRNEGRGAREKSETAPGKSDMQCEKEGYGGEFEEERARRLD